MKRVSVFCGAHTGRDERYRRAAADLGRLLVRENMTLVFGGGSVGLMGVLSNSVLEAGGEVIGVIPRMLATKGLLHPGVSDMRLVPDMHARKALMAELSDGFIALPGGYGTLEELLEIVTWAQLGIHAKKIGLLSVAGFFDPLVRMIQLAVGEGFICPEHQGLIVVEERPDKLLERMEAHPMPSVRKWLGPDET